MLFRSVAPRAHAAPVGRARQAARGEVDDELARAADDPVGVALGPHRNITHRRVGAHRPGPRNSQQVALPVRIAATHQHRRQRIDERPGFPALFHRSSFRFRQPLRGASRDKDTDKPSGMPNLFVHSRDTRIFGEAKDTDKRRSSASRHMSNFNPFLPIEIVF